MELYYHQKKAIQIMRNMEITGKGGILADEMGLGKTITMLAYIKLYSLELPTLIVCNLSLLEHWKEKIEIMIPEATIYIYHGKYRKEQTFEGKNVFIITTYFTMALDIFNLNKNNWSRIVLDEAHNIKNGFKKYPPKCFLAACELSKKSEYNWCITGTPFNNNIMDISSLCVFIGTQPYNDFNYWKYISNETVKEWKSKYILRRLKTTMLPSIHTEIVNIEPTPKESIIINKLKKEAYKKYVEWTYESGNTKKELHGVILAMILKLRIYSDSYICGKKEFDIDNVMDNCSKVNTIITMIKEKIGKDANKSIVIFSQFVMFLELLKTIVDYTTDIYTFLFTGKMSHKYRNNIVEKFTEENTENKPRVLFISLMAGGTGLTLLPCSTVFITEPWYNPFIEKQAEERVHRIGQKHPVNVYKFYMNNSVETWINGIKDMKLMKSKDLELNESTHDIINKNFTFKDIRKLFTTYVESKEIEEYKKENKDKKKIKLNSKPETKTKTKPKTKPKPKKIKKPKAKKNISC